MLKEIWKIKNGDMMEDYEIYSCDACNEDIECSWPMCVEGDNYHLCWKCSFIEGKITEKEYLKYSGVEITNAHASIEDGNVTIWIGRKPTCKRDSNQQRNSQHYKEWRTSVFERDNYTCQHCNQRGGKLNAHHIKSFKNYPKLRLVVENGITLCLECHKKEHRKGGD